MTKGKNIAASSPMSQAVRQSLCEILYRRLRSQYLFGFTNSKDTPLFLLALCFAIASGIITPAMSIFLGRIFESFMKYGAGILDSNGLTSQIATDALILVALGAGTWILYGLYFGLWIVYGELQAKHCRIVAFKQLGKRPIEWFDCRSMPTLLSSFQRQVRELQIATSQPFGILIENVTTIFAAIGIALYYSWNVTLVTLATMPLVAIGTSLLSARMQSCIQDQQKELSLATGHACNAFSAIDVVKCCNAREIEEEKYSRRIEIATGHFWRLAKLNSIQIGLVRTVVLSMFVQGFWYGSHLIQETEPQTRGQVVANIITAFWSCLTAVQSIDQMAPQLLVLAKGRQSGKFLQEFILAHPSEIPDPTKMSVPRQCLGNIRFRDVSLYYPASPNSLALENINCFLPAGRTTFFVGRSGSGKSTMAQLLTQFYTPTSGSIELDDVPLDHIDPDWLKRNLLLVEQAVVLFQGSLFENLTLGMDLNRRVTTADLDVSDGFSSVFQYLEILPAYQEDIISTKSDFLSGGQKQLLALARARLRDPPILILDEATSALDQISRNFVMQIIREWRRGKTTLVITHDLEQIHEDDTIYFFQDGRLSRYEEQLPIELNEKGFNIAENTKPLLTGSFKERFSFTLDQEPVHLSRCSQKRCQRPLQSTIVAPDNDGIELLQMDSTPAAPSGCTGLPATIDLIPDFSSPKIQYECAESIKCKDEILEAKSCKIQEKRPSYSRISLLRPAKAARASRNSLDPLLSNYVVSRRQDTSNYSTVNAKPSRIDQSVIPLFDILRTIWPSISPRARYALITGFVAATAHAVGTPIFSYVFAKLVATFLQPGTNSDTSLKLSLSILGIAIFDGMACFVMHSTLEYAGQAWVDGLRTMAMQKILRQPKAFFSEEFNTPTQLAQSLDRNCEEMRNILGRFSAFMFVAVLMMIMTIVWSLAVCWKLTLVGLSITPIAYFCNRIFSAVSEKAESNTTESAKISASILEESFGYVKTVRALNAEHTFRKKYDAAVQHSFAVGLKRALFCGAFFGASESLILFAIALLFYFGAVLAASKEFTIEAILLVLSMLLFGIGNLSSILEAVPQIQSSKDAATRLLRLVRLHSFTHEDVGSVQIKTPGPITFRNLSFAYPATPHVLVLHDLNFTIQPGTCTAIVGPSGCGKSTILSLLLRLYEATPSNTSALTINNRAITRLHTPTLRSTISYVPQTPVLLAATVAENIAYGLPALNSAAIHAAATAAGIADFITSLPSGYATHLGDGGLALSGGQMQRIAIARALARRPRVLLLDEVTSALDGESAGVVRDTLQRLRSEDPDMTVVVVTHEPEMMRIADRVVMLEGGTVVEEGGFEELARRGGKFARMLRRGVDG